MSFAADSGSDELYVYFFTAGARGSLSVPVARLRGF